MKTLPLLMFASAGALLAAPGYAQNAANVKDVVRVVKTAKGASLDLVTAKPGAALAVGDRVRTGGRSYAGLQFQDKSVLRVGELSEVVVTGNRQRETQVVKGKVFLNYNTPGTITGGYAVAAIRGTHVEYRSDTRLKRAEVRCYKGRVFVSSADNPLVAGAAQSLTETTLIDSGTAGGADFTTGQILFVDGPYAGQSRRITAFNSSTGTVTFAPALAPTPGAGPHGYLLVKNPRRMVVELKDGQGTTVPEGKDPEAPFAIPNEEWAFLDRDPWFEGDQQYLVTYPGTIDHWKDQDQDWIYRDALDFITRRPSHDPEDCGGLPLPIPGQGRRPRAMGRAGIQSALRQELASARIRESAFQDDGSGARGVPTVESRFLPTLVRQPNEPNPRDFVQFRIEPTAIGARQNSAAGVRARLQASSGDAYAELGYRFLAIDGGRNQSDISEGFIALKGHYGNIVAGRQHMFYGPANNTDLATLLGLESTDAFVYQAPLKRGYRQEVGYILDTNATRKGGTRGGFARGVAPLRGGYVGYSVLASTERGKQVGYSLDISQPLKANVLDVYGEAGVGIDGRRITTAGLYVPALYQALKLDVFLEYAVREDLDERFTARFRREFGDGLLLVGFVDRRPGEAINFGGGVQWSLKFH